MTKEVFIGIGHGGSDPGSQSAGLVEKNVNLVMGLACKAELERHGVIVRMSRTIDENDPVSQEVRECNAFNPDIAIEIHNNAGGGDGFEAFYWSGDANGLRLGRLIETEVKSIGQNSRGLKSGNKLMFVNSTKTTAVLLEGFFLDNAKDRTIADTTAEQQAFGRAYAKGVLKYLGITYKNPVEPKPPVTNTGKLYKVHAGAFKDKVNAENRVKALQAKGFEACIVYE